MIIFECELMKPVSTSCLTCCVVIFSLFKVLVILNFVKNVISMITRLLS